MDTVRLELEGGINHGLALRGGINHGYGEVNTGRGH